MTLSQAYQLANDSDFRTLLLMGAPPRAGRITALEASGQVRVEMDDPDGGDALAWPLDGTLYAVGDIVYVLFAANSPDSGIVVGSRSLAPTDISTLRVSARDSSGLRVEDDAGNLGLFVEDGGDVGINTTAPRGRLHTWDGLSGFLLWSSGAVDTTLVTILPNGIGDASYGLHLTYVLENGGSVVANTTTLITPQTRTVTWSFVLNADGSFTVQRTAGTGTARIGLKCLWL